MPNTSKAVIFHGWYFLFCDVLFCKARNFLFFFQCPLSHAGFTATVESSCDPLRHVAYHLLYFAITLFNLCLYLPIHSFTNIYSPAHFPLILRGSVSFRLTSLLLWRKKNLQVTDYVRYLQVFLVKARMEKTCILKYRKEMLLRPVFRMLYTMVVLIDIVG
jgi:hypothetical protein